MNLVEFFYRYQAYGNGIKPYESGRQYKYQDIILSSDLSKLYIALRDFTATDEITDISLGNIQSLVGSKASLKKVVFSNVTSGQSFSIPLSKPNYNYDRFAYVLKLASETSLLTQNVPPNTLTWSKSEGVIVDDNGLYLFYNDTKLTTNDGSLVYNYTTINTNDYYDITKIYNIINDGVDYEYFYHDELKKIFIRIPELTDSITLYACQLNEAPSPTLNAINLYDDCTNLDNWNQYYTGRLVIDTTAFGRPVIKKVDNCEPSGGVRNLNRNIDSNFTFYVKTNRLVNDTCLYDRYRLMDVNGDGLGISITYSNQEVGYDLINDYRGTYVSATSVPGIAFGDWLWLKVSKKDTFYTIAVYDDNLNELALSTRTDTSAYTYTQFGIHGGKPYYADEILVFHSPPINLSISDVTPKGKKIVATTTSTTYTDFTIEVDYITTTNIAVSSKLGLLFTPDNSNEVYKYDVDNNQFVSIGKTTDEIELGDFMYYSPNQDIPTFKTKLINELGETFNVLTPRFINDVTLEVYTPPGLALTSITYSGILYQLSLTVQNEGADIYMC